MKTKLLVFIFLNLVVNVQLFSSNVFDGYKDVNGNYVWFTNKTDSVFIDSTGCEWTKVTSILIIGLKLQLSEILIF